MVVTLILVVSFSGASIAAVTIIAEKKGVPVAEVLNEFYQSVFDNSQQNIDALFIKR